MVTSMLVPLFGSPRGNQSLSKWPSLIKSSNIQSSCTFDTQQTRKTLNDTHLLQKKYTWPSPINTSHFSFVKISSLILLEETLSNWILRFPISDFYWFKYRSKPHCKSHSDFCFASLDQKTDQPPLKLHLSSFRLPSPLYKNKHQHYEYWWV